MCVCMRSHQYVWYTRGERRAVGAACRAGGIGMYSKITTWGVGIEPPPVYTAVIARAHSRNAVSSSTGGDGPGRDPGSGGRGWSGGSVGDSGGGGGGGGGCGVSRGRRSVVSSISWSSPSPSSSPSRSLRPSTTLQTPSLTLLLALSLSCSLIPNDPSPHPSTVGVSGIVHGFVDCDCDCDCDCGVA